MAGVRDLVGMSSTLPMTQELDVRGNAKGDGEDVAAKEDTTGLEMTDEKVISTSSMSLG